MAHFTSEDALRYWVNITPEAHDSAIYGASPFDTLFQAQVERVAAALTPGSSLVEVGCGTCHFCGGFIGKAETIVGVDVSQKSTSEAAQNYANRPELVLVTGDASNLVSLLKKNPALTDVFWTRNKVVSCVMNTLGIMPQEIRPSVVAEMVRLADNGGTVLISVFDGRFFERGVEEFYQHNNQLTGEFSNNDVDLAAHELHVRSSGYYSHWFTTEELDGLARDAGMETITVHHPPWGIILEGR